MPSTISSGTNTKVDSGNTVTEILRNPYAPIFSITPASSIEPAVGAWTWASGSHVWTGTLGILVANPMSRRIQMKCLSPSLGIRFSCAVIATRSK